MSDLTYKEMGLFTLFLPESPKGEIAWKTIAAHTDGTGKVFTVHAKSTIMQLRAAGYSVIKAKKITVTDDELYTALFNNADTNIIK